MRRIVSALLAVSSLMLALRANAATRPRYGGTLHVSMSAAPVSLDPGDTGASFLATLSRLVFDTLVTLDDRGRTQPGLATSWQAEPGSQRWNFYLRRGVTFHDGSAVTSDAVAASLRNANAQWKIFAAGDAVAIETGSPDPNLPAELALPRYGIAKRSPKLLGTGPFAIADWQAGKKLTLVARDDYWGGRPFLDSIEIELGRSPRDQMIALDLGKADLIAIAPDQARRIATDSARLETSATMELIALEFSRERQSAEDGRLRQALGLSMDRASMNVVLLPGAGEPAGSLLPNWMTGYGFLFPASFDPAHARQVRGELKQNAPWTLGYDAGDPVSRLLADRIALNARDAGLTLQLTTSSSADIRLVRIPLSSLDARVALANLAATLGLPQPRFSSNSSEELFAAESTLLASQRVIPLLHVRTFAAHGATVKNWSESLDGRWRLESVWLGPGKP